MKGKRIKKHLLFLSDMLIIFKVHIHVYMFMINLLIFRFLFLPLSLHFHLCGMSSLLIDCFHDAFFLAVFYFTCFPVFDQLGPAFVGVGRIASDEGTLVILKQVAHFSFTYGVLRSFSIIVGH